MDSSADKQIYEFKIKQQTNRN